MNIPAHRQARNTLWLTHLLMVNLEALSKDHNIEVSDWLKYIQNMSEDLTVLTLHHEFMARKDGD